MASPATATAGHRIRAGFATVDHNSSRSLEMGGFGMNIERKGEAVHDPLLARATVLDKRPGKS